MSWPIWAYFSSRLLTFCSIVLSIRAVVNSVIKVLFLAVDAPFVKGLLISNRQFLMLLKIHRKIRVSIQAGFCAEIQEIVFFVRQSRVNGLRTNQSDRPGW